MSVKILSSIQVEQKIRRLAYQIYENNFDQEAVFLVGIRDMGFHLAEALQAVLKQISSLEVVLVGLEMDKSNPLRGKAELSHAVEELAHQNIVLIDDVLNSGKTMFYALQPFFAVPIKKLQTLVLVNRDYKSFPVNPDYVGYSLATTLQNHVSVVLDSEEKGVYLK
ncbi:MAG: phosphoribosyltransferase domain-containing protein [Raineya sp.]